jgi:hypothetical protein
LEGYNGDRCEMDMCEAVDRIVKYSKILENYKYIHNNIYPGEKPWSNRYEHKNGSRVEIRRKDWTFYNTNGEEIQVGIGPETLEIYLESIMNEGAN